MSCPVPSPAMPDYRAEVWFTYPSEDMEDCLEEHLRDFMNANNMRCQGGPVVFRIYPPVRAV